MDQDSPRGGKEGVCNTVYDRGRVFGSTDRNLRWEVSWNDAGIWTTLRVPLRNSAAAPCGWVFQNVVVFVHWGSHQTFDLRDTVQLMECIEELVLEK